VVATEGTKVAARINTGTVAQEKIGVEIKVNRQTRLGAKIRTLQST